MRWAWRAPDDDRMRSLIRRLPFFTALIAVVVPLLLLGACGSDTGSPAAAGPTSTSSPTSASTTTASDKATVVLVHGAFAGPSSWDAVAASLETAGFRVVVSKIPLQGPSTDARAVADDLDAIDGPVILVGHSYGGIVITNAAVGHPNVKALVYISAFVPDQGESLGSLQAKFPGSITPDVLDLQPYIKPDGTSSVQATIKPEAFRATFAADLSPDAAASLAQAQHPIDAGALQEPSGTPAWRSIPSWYLRATDDLVITKDAAEFMAGRANAKVHQVSASHAVLVSQPATVVDLIRQAAGTVG
jgi:pimeloyl-ACP methyl ester carboxylesterase